jgi:hypothetical protein
MREQGNVDECLGQIRCSSGEESIPSVRRLTFHKKPIMLIKFGVNSVPITPINIRARVNMDLFCDVSYPADLPVLLLECSDLAQKLWI